MADPRHWVASCYRFEPLRRIDALASALERECAARGIRGTVLLAAEGWNAALSGTRANLEETLSGFFPACRPNWTPLPPGAEAFKRLRVRRKPEVITCGHPMTPATPVGAHVDAAAWNRLLADPRVLVLDVRNEYESAIGGFPRAKPANTDAFGEFPAFARDSLAASRERPVAMYCTGGIRCEKASALLLEAGFGEVFQLAGGILGYLAATRPGDNAFEGECFVFDDRVSVRRDLAPGGFRLCRGCGRPTSSDAACPACSPPALGAAPPAEREGAGGSNI